MAVLLINRSDSECGDCHRNADPYEKAHDTVWDWQGDEEGCHAVFTELGSAYRGGGIVEAAKAMRPDLPWTESLGLY